MKLIIKNLKQVSFNIEINIENPSVLDLKKEIEKTNGFEATQLKLLFNGVILEDSKTLEDYKIKDESTIIMMNSKVKPKNVQPQSNTDSSQPKAEEKKPEEKKPEEPKPKKEEKQQKPPEQQFTQQINSLVDMGFEREKAEAAIKAARGQIDLAVDFLYNGIPEGINDNIDDLDMEEGQDEEEGDDNGGEEADPIKTVASIAKILCHDNPGALSELLQSIQQTNPDLFSLLNEREDEFKSLLEQPISEDDYRAFHRYGRNLGLEGEGEEHPHHHGEGHGQIRINLTPQEREAVQRLKDLGNFEEAEVVQAYIACDKNEELTANYLFEQKMRDDDEMFGGGNNNNNNGNGQ